MEAGTGAVACHDLRGTATRRTLRYPAGDVLVVSGLPGGGKSTLIRSAFVQSALVRPALAQEAAPARKDVVRIDSQDTRERWERRLPVWLPYGVYRPLVRMAHYAGLRRALASGASVVVHDCGTQSWVRRWLARDAVRRRRALHLLLLDVTPEDALAGQAARGRGVSGYAFRRHLRAVRKLTAAAESGRLPAGCVSSVLLDRAAAQALRGITFTAHAPTHGAAPLHGPAPTPTVPPPARGDGTVNGDTGDANGRTPDATGVSGPAQA
ncbi:ATP-binding protein [Streptomyces iconiensis]|uniref:ATP-binding protein n=1 Tax=Streptomyces iconiensis TaxID=1384038 RepID=A0ABT7A7A0_9ACTN|nr:ATP-binding protein [Streptomyces iconiensis]MDJ1137212.1 ATP-binding protein [Streptomyces iconiensis]